jgi:hypothetical protein
VSYFGYLDPLLKCRVHRVNCIPCGICSLDRKSSSLSARVFSIELCASKGEYDHNLIQQKPHAHDSLVAYDDMNNNLNPNIPRPSPRFHQLGSYTILFVTFN